MNLDDVHEEILPLLYEDTIIVEDSYYLDDDKSRTLLRENKVRYLSAINPVRFSEVWDKCSKSVKKKGDWTVYYNNKTKEHAMMKWDPVGEKKQYCLDQCIL